MIATSYDAVTFDKGGYEGGYTVRRMTCKHASPSTTSATSYDYTRTVSPPSVYAKMHCAYALLSSYPARILTSPSCPNLSRNHLQYGPGSPLM